MKNAILIGASVVISLTIVMGFKRISNTAVRTVDIGVIVSDLEKSFDFYTNILGMQKVDTWSSSKEMSTQYGVNSGKAFDIINLKLECDGYVLKYKLNKTEGNFLSTPTNTKEYYGFEKISSRYLTINVESVEPFIDRIKNQNIKHKIIVFPDGFRVVLVHDPDGALIEIAGY